MSLHSQRLSKLFVFYKEGSLEETLENVYHELCTTTDFAVIAIIGPSALRLDVDKTLRVGAVDQMQTALSCASRIGWKVMICGTSSFIDLCLRTHTVGAELKTCFFTLPRSDTSIQFVCAEDGCYVRSADVEFISASQSDEEWEKKKAARRQEKLLLQKMKRKYNKIIDNVKLKYRQAILKKMKEHRRRIQDLTEHHLRTVAKHEKTLHEVLTGMQRPAESTGSDVDPRCVVCFDAHRSVVYSCGHLAICDQCAERMKKKSCPICQRGTTPRHVFWA